MVVAVPRRLGCGGSSALNAAVADAHGRAGHRHGGVAGLAVAVAIAGALARWAFGRSRDAGAPASAPPEGFAREVL